MQLVEVDAVAQRRDQHRHGVGGLEHRVDVFLADAVERMHVDDAAIRGHADQGFAARHV